MSHDQADVLRHLVRQSQGEAPCGPSLPLVVVHGGKGGVGATTLSANLAMAFQRQGRRAAWIDANLDHGGSADWGQRAHDASILDVLTARRSIDEAIYHGPSGLWLLSGAWAGDEHIPDSAASYDRFIADLKTLTPYADVVVIDAGSGRGTLARRLWQAAGAVLVASTSEPVSIMESYATIKVLRHADASPDMFTLVNRVASDAIGEDVHGRISAACRKFLGFTPWPAGYVPICESQREQERMFIFPARIAAAAALDRAADMVWARLQLQKDEQRASQAARVGEPALEHAA